jgi:hypothetical protein
MFLRVVHSSVHVQLFAVLSGRPRCNVSTAGGSSCQQANLLRTLLTVRVKSMLIIIIIIIKSMLTGGYNRQYDCSVIASGSMCLRVMHSSVHVHLFAVLSGRPRCNVSTAGSSSC